MDKPTYFIKITRNFSTMTLLMCFIFSFLLLLGLCLLSDSIYHIKCNNNSCSVRNYILNIIPVNSQNITNVSQVELKRVVNMGRKTYCTKVLVLKNEKNEINHIIGCNDELSQDAKKHIQQFIDGDIQNINNRYGDLKIQILFLIFFLLSLYPLYKSITEFRKSIILKKNTFICEITPDHLYIQQQYTKVIDIIHYKDIENLQLIAGKDAEKYIYPHSETFLGKEIETYFYPFIKKLLGATIQHYFSLIIDYLRRLVMEMRRDYISRHESITRVENGNIQSERQHVSISYAYIITLKNGHQVVIGEETLDIHTLLKIKKCIDYYIELTHS